jgi:DNA-binding transcriptional regulator YdaS (Cro superfamily)
MSFKSYYDSLDSSGKKELSGKMKVTLGYLSQLATGHRKAGIHVIAKIERATNGALTREQLRPDVFGV